jgi:hypothetical protein
MLFQGTKLVETQIKTANFPSERHPRGDTSPTRSQRHVRVSDEAASDIGRALSRFVNAARNAIKAVAMVDRGSVLTRQPCPIRGAKNYGQASHHGTH